MNAVWQVQEAKNRFSEVIECALHEGPQTVTRHGKPVVRVVAVQDERAQAAPKDDRFLQFLLSIPKVDGFEPPPRRSSRKRRPVVFDDELGEGSDPS